MVVCFIPLCQCTKVKAVVINEDTLLDLGFTGDMIDKAACDRDYDWYVDQGNTGSYSSSNCGPAVATMAAKWDNEEFKKTGEDARNSYSLCGGCWFTTTVTQYLNDNNVANYYDNYNYDKEQIKDLIKDREIAILCINPYYLTPTENNSYIGRFYEGSYAHFIIIKGYVETTDNFYIEVYDPASFGQKNENGTIKGQLRYYTIKDLNNSIISTWQYMIVVVDM